MTSAESKNIYEGVDSGTSYATNWVGLGCGITTCVVIHHRTGERYFQFRKIYERFAFEEPIDSVAEMKRLLTFMTPICAASIGYRSDNLFQLFVSEIELKRYITSMVLTYGYQWKRVWRRLWPDSSYPGDGLWDTSADDIKAAKRKPSGAPSVRRVTGLAHLGGR